ncbi:MAG: flagellar basal-body MS-ring/collar protein FliF [Myxococcota bacterium]
MEPLLAQLKMLPERLRAVPAGIRNGVIALVATLGVIGLVTSLTVGQGAYEVVFATLSSEEIIDAQAALRDAGIPHRVEAGGQSLVAPRDKVYDARMLLAARGIPRAGGIGFELFDKSDLGVSEFTQNVNLRRALEGELSRTIAGLDVIQSSRVHITMPKRGLFREENTLATASVVVKLYPGRRLTPEQIKGIRHLVSAAVPELLTERVTIVDQSGAALSSEDDEGEALRNAKSRMEQELETRLTAVLELAVGQGAVAAKVTADLDNSEVETTEQLYDADNPALRSERLRNISSMKQVQDDGSVVGAAANQPNADVPQPSNGDKKESDELRNYELSTTVKKSRRVVPELTRLSVAVVVRVPDEKNADVAALTELAKKAVGFNEARGDQMEVLVRPGLEVAELEDAPTGVLATLSSMPPWVYPAVGGALLLTVLAGVLLVRRRRERLLQAEELKMLAGGRNVADIERELAGLPEALEPAQSAEEEEKGPTAEEALLERARLLAVQDPGRAAHLLHAWMESDRNGAREQLSDG